jgi:hypothetical protein
MTAACALRAARLLLPLAADDCIAMCIAAAAASQQQAAASSSTGSSSWQPAAGLLRAAAAAARRRCLWAAARRAAARSLPRIVLTLVELQQMLALLSAIRNSRICQCRSEPGRIPLAFFQKMQGAFWAP